MKKNCEICGSNKINPALNLGKSPLCDDLIKFNSNRKSKLYKIQIYTCSNCITAFQKYNVNRNKLFPKTYHYRARFTKDVISGFKEIVRKSLKIFSNMKNKNILDIGCNDGSLLTLYKSYGANTIGVEPTNASKDAKKAGHKIYAEYFTSKTVKKINNKFKNIDLIIFTNVFAHIEDLNKLINNLKNLVSDQTYLIIENHYMGSVIKKNQFDTFYHEHPRTYSATSFFYIAKKLNMNIKEIQLTKRYGGNIRVILTKNNTKLNLNKMISVEKSFCSDLKKMQTKINLWLDRKTKIIHKFNKKYGPLECKAFPGRASILINLLNLNNKNISAIYEKPGSMKIGNFAPNTKIPIKSDLNLFKKISEIKVILNLAWHIPNEINSYLRKNKFKGRIINIIDQKDFI